MNVTLLNVDGTKFVSTLLEVSVANVLAVGKANAAIKVSMFMIKFEVNPLVKIVYNSEAQLKHLYKVFINGADLVYHQLKVMDHECKGTLKKDRRINMLQQYG